MTTPLSKLLIDLLTDPDGRQALSEDPAGVLADNGWEDLTPRDMGDALRHVTASGPAAAAHAGSELPEQPTSFAEVVEPVLGATTELDSWDAGPGTPLIAGAIEPETFDFAPPPLVGIDPELAADPHDDPFLRSDASQEPPTSDEGDAAPTDDADVIDLSFGEAEASDAAPEADETTEPGTGLDDLDADDGMTLRDAPGMDIADDLALPDDEGSVDDAADELADELDLSWEQADAPAEAPAPLDVGFDHVDELEPIVEVVDEVDTPADLDGGDPDFDDLD
ncbi:MAG: hypothetical protein AAFZ07_28550 [Actinomycetota bacterium]